MLKVGDKLLCKRSASFSKSKRGICPVSLKFRKDEIYVITKIILDKRNTEYFVKSDGDTCKFVNRLWIYFYKQNDIVVRKKKLQKLKKINEI